MKREQALEDDVKALRETVMALQAKLEQLESAPIPIPAAASVETNAATSTVVSPKAEV